ncbi:MAG: signal peptidase I [Myxococcota bacterium]|nr:signal peptidase I [Myxococcota bacterium]
MVDSGERRGGWRKNVRTIALAVALAFGVRIGIAQAYEVDGPSMEPTVFQNERVLVARCAYGLSLPGVENTIVRWSAPRAGDVVIVQSPRDGLDLVKRVIGVPGDVIEVRDGVIHRNGVAIEQREVGACDPSRQLDPDPSCRVYEEAVSSSSAAPADASDARRWQISRSALDLALMLPVEVPEGHVFVVGDHRDRSNDSRAFGPIPTSRVRGRVLFVD